MACSISLDISLLNESKVVANFQALNVCGDFF